MSAEPTLPTKKLRWNTGVCGKESRPHLENENHFCRGWYSTLDLPEPTLPVSRIEWQNATNELASIRNGTHPTQKLATDRLAERDRELQQAREEATRVSIGLADAISEAVKCDDVKLDQPLAGIIADLQKARRLAESELSEAREEIARLKKALARILWTNTWHGAYVIADLALHPVPEKPKS